MASRDGPAKIQKCSELSCTRLINGHNIFHMLKSFNEFNELNSFTSTYFLCGPKHEIFLKLKTTGCVSKSKMEACLCLKFSCQQNALLVVYFNFDFDMVEESEYFFTALKTREVLPTWSNLPWQPSSSPHFEALSCCSGPESGKIINHYHSYNLWVYYVE